MSIMAVLASISLVAVLVEPRRVRASRRPWRSGRSGRPTSGLDRVGARLGAGLPFDPMLGPRTLALVALAAPAMLLVSPIAMPMPIVVAAVVSVRRRRRQRLDTESLIARGLPDVVDLLTMAVGAGLTAQLAMSTTAPWLPEPYRTMASEVHRRTGSGEPFSAALEAAADGLGPDARPLTATLVAAQTDGAALLPALERVGDEARRRRRVAAEDRARRIPVAMLFPLVICVLPAFALLTVVPLLVGTISELQLPG